MGQQGEIVAFCKADVKKFKIYQNLSIYMFYMLKCALKLIKAPSSSGLGHQVLILVTWVRVPMGSLTSFIGVTIW